MLVRLPLKLPTDDTDRSSHQHHNQIRIFDWRKARTESLQWRLGSLGNENPTASLPGNLQYGMLPSRSPEIVSWKGSTCSRLQDQITSPSEWNAQWFKTGNFQRGSCCSVEYHYHGMVLEQSRGRQTSYGRVSSNNKIEGRSGQAGSRSLFTRDDLDVCHNHHKLSQY